jgi:hypothetical protein
VDYKQRTGGICVGCSWRGKLAYLGYRKIARGSRAVGAFPLPETRNAYTVNPTSGSIAVIVCLCFCVVCYVLSGVAQCGVECGRILDLYIVPKIKVTIAFARCGMPPDGGS